RCGSTSNKKPGTEPAPPAKADFAGQLSETPLFVILRRIQRGRLSGTLSIFREEQVRQLFFEHGELRSSRSAREDHRIGATLVRWGYISEKDLQETLDIQRRTHQRIDEILVERGLVTRPVVDSEARRQMEQIIFSTLAWPSGQFHFEANTGPAHLDVAVSFSEDVIIEGIRRIPESEQFVDLLGDLKSVPRLTRDPMSSKSFRMLKDAVDVLDRIDGRTTFEDLLGYASSSGSAAAKILYSLMFAGLIETAPVEEALPTPAADPSAAAEDTFGEQTQPLTRRASRDTSGRGAGARPVPRPATDAKRQLVLDTYRQLDWLSHYDLLGVSRKATQEEIDAAYETRARLFDPSPKAHPDLVDLWRQLTVLSRWIKVAHGVLSDPENRANYDKKIAEAIPPLPPPGGKS
ncbi:MAG TPA: DUF4388 domain-containing protein, partial [Thermoanaerobaculia bacterium]